MKIDRSFGTATLTCPHRQAKSLITLFLSPPLVYLLQLIAKAIILKDRVSLNLHACRATSYSRGYYGAVSWANKF
jgi:hypothetical protein